jgi:hypothetical protein
MRTLKYVIIAFVAIVVIIFTASILKSGAEYSKMKIFVDSLFILGALFVMAGGFIAGGFSKPTFREWYGHSTKDPDRQAEIFLEYRRAQLRQGVFILIFGLALICLSVAIGTYLRF